jgi:hypothetical protein
MPFFPFVVRVRVTRGLQLHGPDVDAKRQGAATSVAYEQPRRILQYKWISQQESSGAVNFTAWPFAAI